MGLYFRLTSLFAYQGSFRAIANLRGGNQRFLAWLQSLRAPFLLASLLPAFLGATEAYRRGGSIDINRLLLTLSCVACIHLAANLANDYFDEKTNCDRINIEPTPFSGGSRVIQRGSLSSRAVGVSSAGFAILGCIQGLWLLREVPLVWLVLIGALGLFCGFGYSAPPIKASYRGFGEVLVLVGFGPLTVAAGYGCQTGSLDIDLLYLGLPAGLLVLSILLVNEVIDIKWDDLAGKRTSVVILGRQRGFALYVSSYIGAYLLLAVWLAREDLPKIAVMSFLPLLLTIPRFLKVSAIGVKSELIKLSGLTMLSNLVTIGWMAVANLI